MSEVGYLSRKMRYLQVQLSNNLILPVRSMYIIILAFRQRSQQKRMDKKRRVEICCKEGNISKSCEHVCSDRIFPEVTLFESLFYN